MSVTAVFRKDFRDSSRSRMLWVTIAVFVVLAGLFTFGYVEFLVSDLLERSAELATFGLVWVLSGQLLPGIGPIPLVVPLIGLLLGHKAIVGEREGGQLKFLLGLPHSRSEVVAGKMLGRSLVAVVALLAGFVVTALLMILTQGLSFGPFAALLVVTVLFALVYVAIGIGISAAVPSSGVATALIVLTYATFQFGWNVVFLALRELAVKPSSAPPNWTAPGWFQFLKSINPANAYNAALTAALEAVGDVPAELQGRAGRTVASAPEPLYLSDGFGFVLLAFWILAPLVAGYLVFDRADLG